MPPVDECLRALEKAPHASGVSREYLKKLVQQAVDRLREEVMAAEPSGIGDRAAITAEIVRRVGEALARDEPAVKPLINATGVVLHTNLGRAILPEPAIEAI